MNSILCKNHAILMSHHFSRKRPQYQIKRKGLSIPPSAFLEHLQGVLFHKTFSCLARFCLVSQYKIQIPMIFLSEPALSKYLKLHGFRNRTSMAMTLEQRLLVSLVSTKEIKVHIKAGINRQSSIQYGVRSRVTTTGEYRDGFFANCQPKDTPLVAGSPGLFHHAIRLPDPEGKPATPSKLLALVLDPAFGELIRSASPPSKTGGIGGNSNVFCKRNVRIIFS